MVLFIVDSCIVEPYAAGYHQFRSYGAGVNPKEKKRIVYVSFSFELTLYFETHDIGSRTNVVAVRFNYV